MKEAGDFTFTFLTDDELEVIDYVQMRSENMSKRGISILDKDGTYVHHYENDLWGEQIQATSNMIHEHFEKMAK